MTEQNPYCHTHGNARDAALTADGDQLHATIREHTPYRPAPTPKFCHSDPDTGRACTTVEFHRLLAETATTSCDSIRSWLYTNPDERRPMPVYEALLTAGDGATMVRLLWRLFEATFAVTMHLKATDPADDPTYRDMFNGLPENLQAVAIKHHDDTQESDHE